MEKWVNFIAIFGKIYDMNLDDIWVKFCQIDMNLGEIDMNFMKIDMNFMKDLWHEFGWNFVKL